MNLNLLKSLGDKLKKKEELSIHPADAFLEKKRKELAEKNAAAKTEENVPGELYLDFNKIDKFFEEEKQSAIQPSKEFDEEETFMDSTTHEARMAEPDYTTMPFISAYLAYIERYGKTDRLWFRFNVHEKPEQPTDYTHMPLGLKEIQQREGVRDHGLDLSEKKEVVTEDNGQADLFAPVTCSSDVIQPILNKLQENVPEKLESITPLLDKALVQAEPSNEMIGDLKRKDDKIVFEENPTGRWHVSSLPKDDMTIGTMYAMGIDPVSIDNQQKAELEVKFPSLVEEMVKVSEYYAREEEELSILNGPKKVHKLRASQIEQDGIIFDSKLENYMYNMLSAEGIKFRFQVEYVLQEKFTYRHETIRPMAIVMDFVLDDFNTIIDTKGWQLADNKLKHKMLKKHLYDLGTEMRIEIPSSQKQCRKLIEMLRTGFVLDEPLTENAAKIRKNKLKNTGWNWHDGKWTKADESYDAKYLMSLPVFEFTEVIKPKDQPKPKIQKVTFKEQPHLFDDITEFAIDSIKDHRRGSNFFRTEIIEFTKENAKWFTKVPNFEDYLGTWRTNTVIWDSGYGWDETFSELERVEPTEVKKITYK